jgi:hypothetical protein
MASIPASAIVNVVPGVLTAGASAVSLNGLLVTGTATGLRVPVGAVQTFTSAASVSAYFGPTSQEATFASIYFAGSTNSYIKPGALLVAPYPLAAVPAWLRGGSLSAVTLTTLKTYAGTITVTVNGSPITSSAITLTAATSFSNAATIIQAAFTSPPFTVSWDSVSSAFVFTTTLTGASATFSATVTGTSSASLLLTAATGSVVSQGAAAATPAAFMSSIAALSGAWDTFTTIGLVSGQTTWDPDNGAEPPTNKLLFANWNAAQGNEFLYVATDTDAQPTTSANATGSFGNILNVAQTSGTMPLYDPNSIGLAAFAMGAIASIDFAGTNTRVTLAFQNSAAGLAPVVTSQSVGANLDANGYNYYGTWATTNDQFTFLYPGSVTGAFAWADAYVNAIWLNNSFQNDLMVLLTSAGSIPYNAAGYAMISASLMSTIQQALTFGAIRAGVTLSSTQVAEVNSLAGKAIDGILSTRGWYLLIQDATPSVRVARGTPPMTFWYTDGGAIQSINLASIDVQ